MFYARPPFQLSTDDQTTKQRVVVKDLSKARRRQREKEEKLQRELEGKKLNMQTVSKKKLSFTNLSHRELKKGNGYPNSNVASKNRNNNLKNENHW
ncbi:hypothetical protein C5167_015209 [Papaver somniferum]|uniref:Uncharacterized protein n=1 Tax=Papaver somniferum TaxID=3469 RepID=A0A4Y7J6A5_PAPSO|nr:hypothetical protein C5167_015209 [Papaver somniferum]